MLCVRVLEPYPRVMYVRCMCGTVAEMDMATWNFCTAVGHALDVVVADNKKKTKKHTP